MTSCLQFQKKDKRVTKTPQRQRRSLWVELLIHWSRCREFLCACDSKSFCCLTVYVFLPRMEENVRRMNTSVKLNEMIVTKSHDAALVIVNLPSPPQQAGDEENCIQLLFSPACLLSLTPSLPLSPFSLSLSLPLPLLVHLSLSVVGCP